MNRIEVRCPACQASQALPAEARGNQANCPHCHHVFTVPAETPATTPSAARLELVLDPDLTDHPYRVLAGQGITPDSPLADVQTVFPESDAEMHAQETLHLVKKRLAVDLLLYPIWRPTVGEFHGSI